MSYINSKLTGVVGSLSGLMLHSVGLINSIPQKSVLVITSRKVGKIKARSYRMTALIERCVMHETV